MAAAVIGGSTLVGCSAEECTTEADCAGYACVFEAGAETGTCAEECMSNAECATGYNCKIDAGETVGACFRAPPTGCTADSQCGAYTCGAGGQCNTACTDGSECNEGFQCDEASSVCQAVAPVAFQFAAVVSEVAPGSDDAEEPNPGPDVDAIYLVAGGTEIPATTVSGGVLGGVTDNGENTRTVANDVTGARSAMTGAGPVFDCDLDDGSGYYSLGDNVGFVVVSFGSEIGDTDTINVYEVDESNCSNDVADRAESYSVFIGAVAAEATSAVAVRTAWCPVGTTLAGGGTFTGIVDLDRCP
jgi:hypothetical protein